MSQAAIDEADEDDAIDVAPGQYEESVSVDTSGLSIVGPNAGVAGNDPARGAPAVIRGEESEYPVRISSSGVTFDGLEVEPAFDATSGTDNEAVLITETDVTVQNTAISNFNGDGQEAIGIAVFNDGTDGIDVTVADTLVTDIEGTDGDSAVGISVAGNVDATVEGSVVTAIGGDSDNFAWGIVAREAGSSGEYPTNVELIGNTITDVTSEDGFGERFFGVGFGWDAGPGTGADAMSATNNSIDTPELIVENKDPDNTIDATENWWGDASGPDEERIAGDSPRIQAVEDVLSDFNEDRGPVDTSDSLSSDPN